MEVLCDRHRFLTTLTEDRFHLKLSFLPPLNRMRLLLLVTEVARVDASTALEADGHNIKRGVVMTTAHEPLPVVENRDF